MELFNATSTRGPVAIPAVAPLVESPRSTKIRELQNTVIALRTEIGKKDLHIAELTRQVHDLKSQTRESTSGTCTTDPVPGSESNPQSLSSSHPQSLVDHGPHIHRHLDHVLPLPRELDLKHLLATFGYSANFPPMKINTPGTLIWDNYIDKISYQRGQNSTLYPGDAKRDNPLN